MPSVLSLVKCNTEKTIVSISFHIEWDMVVVTVFLSILTQMEFHLVQNRKENCHHDHIPFNLKGNRNIVFSVYTQLYHLSSPVLYTDTCIPWLQLNVFYLQELLFMVTPRTV